MKKFMFIFTGILGILAFTGKAGYCLSTTAVIPTAATLISSAPANANEAAVITISSPTGGGAYSTGYYNYLSDLHVVAYATATVTGTGTPITCTVTGVPNSPAILLETAMAVGTLHPRDFSFSNPVQATQGARIVITCPATGSVLWNIWASYFVGN